MPSTRGFEHRSSEVPRIVFLAVLLTLILSVLAIDATHVSRSFAFSPVPASQPWAMLGADAQHTSRSLFVGPQALSTPNNIDVVQGGINSSVVIDSTGVLYVGSTDTANVGRLYALNADGSVRPGWPFVTSGNLNGSPAIGPDGTIYVAFDRSLYAVNPNGTQKWPAPFVISFPFFSSPVVASDGTIIISQGQEGSLYAINPDGTTKWAKVNSAFDGGTPAVAADGTIYAGGGPGFGVTGGMTAINADGTIKWSSNFGGTAGVPAGFFTPVIADDGTLYAIKGTIGSINVTQTLLAIDAANGAVKHERTIQPAASSFGSLVIALGADGTVICSAPQAPSTGYGLTGFSPDLSTVRFTHSFGTDGLPTPATVGADGTIYLSVANPDGTSRVRAFAQNGEIKSEYLLDAQRLSPAALGPDGTLYVGVTFDAETIGDLYAFEGPPPTPTPTPTPTPSPTPVLNQRPTAGFTMSLGSRSATEGQTLNLALPTGPFLIHFTADRSFDPDGTISAWQWKIDGVIVSTASSFKHVASGHVVSLSVTDNDGAVSDEVVGFINIVPQRSLKLFPFNDPDGPFSIRTENVKLSADMISADVVIENLSGTWFELDIDFNAGTVEAPNSIASNNIPFVSLIGPSGTLRFRTSFREGDYLHYKATRTSVAAFTMLAIDLIGRGLLGIEIATPKGQFDLAVQDLTAILNEITTTCGGDVVQFGKCISERDILCLISNLASFLRCAVEKPAFRNLINKVYGANAGQKFIEFGSREAAKVILDLISLFDRAPRVAVLYDATIRARIDGSVRLEARR